MIIFLILLSTIFTIGKNEDPSPKCPPNMIQSHKDPTICYFFVSNATGFDNAEKFCIQNNGHLAPVLDAIANFFIAENAFDAFKNFDDFWIGGKSVDFNGGTIWLWNWQRSFPSFFDWDRGEPKKNGCMASTINTASWTSQNCSAAKPFVCQIPAIVDICDPEWSYFKAPNQDGMCYKYTNKNGLSLTDAQNFCIKQNANLVSIHSEEENSFLLRTVSYGTSEDWPVQGVFIGLHYIDMAWKWLDGTVINYENWGPDRPWNLADRTIAVFYAEMIAGNPLNFTHKWDNFPSTNLFNRLICKKKSGFVSITEKLL